MTDIDTNAGTTVETTPTPETTREDEPKRTQDRRPTPPEPKEPKYPSSSEAVRKALKSAGVETGDDEGPKRGPDGRFASKASDDDEPGSPQSGLESNREPEAKDEDAKPEAKAKAKTEEKPKPEPKAKVEAKEDADAKDADRKDADAKDAEPKAEKKPVADKWADPPKRFNDLGKEAWQNAPKEVRAETTRMISELENGLREYQQKWEPLRELDQLTQQHRTTIQDAMKRYIAFETAIRRNPIEGLRMVGRDIGFDFDQLVSDLAKQPRDQALQQAQQRIAMLERHIQQLGAHQQRAVAAQRQQVAQSVDQQLSEFIKTHPRTEELAEDMARLIKSNLANNLEDAYRKAEAWNPRSEPAPAATATTTAQTRERTQPSTPAQTRNASLSISGAPASGATPDEDAISDTTSKAVKRALRRVGI